MKREIVKGVVTGSVSPVLANGTPGHVLGQWDRPKNVQWFIIESEKKVHLLIKYLNLNYEMLP